MIQKIFNCEVCEPIIEEDIIHVIFPDKNDSAIGFDWSWWNAEYKEPTAKFVEGLPSAYPKSDKSSGEWIPVNNPYTELPKKDLWVTRSDNGNLCVDRIYYDMTEWSDFIGDVVAYMEYKEPAPFKSVDELKEDVYSRAYGLGYYDCFKKFVAKEPEDNSERIDEAIRHLDNYSSTNGSGLTTDKQHNEAKRVAIDIMRKYQKIEDIYYHQSGQALENSLRAVIEDGEV